MTLLEHFLHVHCSCIYVCREFYPGCAAEQHRYKAYVFRSIVDIFGVHSSVDVLSVHAVFKIGFILFLLAIFTFIGKFNKIGIARTYTHQDKICLNTTKLLLFVY